MYGFRRMLWVGRQHSPVRNVFYPAAMTNPARNVRGGIANPAPLRQIPPRFGKQSAAGFVTPLLTFCVYLSFFAGRDMLSRPQCFVPGSNDEPCTKRPGRDCKSRPASANKARRGL